jgi:hypothetical protein
MILAFRFQTIIPIKMIMDDTSMITGAQVSVKSMPCTWLYPHATNHALKNLKIPFVLILNTRLLLTNLLPYGTFFFEITSHTPLFFIYSNSLQMDTRHFTLASGSG